MLYRYKWEEGSIIEEASFLAARPADVKKSVRIRLRHIGAV